MKSVEVEKNIKKIDSVITDINNFSNLTELEKSYLAKFLVVFICGIYEEIIETVIIERASMCKDVNICNYIKTSIREVFRNPKIEKVKGLLSKFDKNWKLEIDNLSDSSKFALDSIVSNKNSIAHGDDIALTLSDVIQYYKDSLAVMEKVDDMLL